MRGFTCICPTPGSWYSIGSSIVRMFLSTELISRERGVKRRRLAAAGRPGHEHDAVALVREPPERREVAAREPELSRAEQRRAAVEQSHDDALAVRRGHRGNAYVEIATGHARADAAVLRQALLGDVHRGHDLDA
jgi:hypothetical protein